MMLCLALRFSVMRDKNDEFEISLIPNFRADFINLLGYRDVLRFVHNFQHELVHSLELMNSKSDEKSDD